MRQIRRQREGGVPIVALAAYTMTGDREKFLAQGFDGYIAKPIDLEHFLKTVEGYLDS